MVIIHKLQLRKSISANLTELTRMQDEILSQFNASKFQYSSKANLSFKANEVIWSCKVTSKSTDTLAPICQIFIIGEESSKKGEESHD